MEDWERKLITQNLTVLADMTNVSSQMLAYLMAKNILSRADVEVLDMEGSHRGAHYQAFILYDILKTRYNAYEILKEVLLETNQSGAFQILLNGEKNDPSFKKKEEKTGSKESSEEEQARKNRKNSEKSDCTSEHEGISESKGDLSSYDENTDETIKTSDEKKSRSSLDIKAPKFQNCPNGLSDTLSSSNISFIFIGTIDTLLTVEKIENTITERNVKVKKIGLWRQLKIFLSDWKKRACMSGNEMMPLLVLHDSTQEKRNLSVEKIMYKIFGLVKTPINLKIVFVLNKDQSDLESYKATYFGNSDQVLVTMDTFSWKDLTQNWQAILLSRQIIDQGQQRTLKEFCDSHVYEQKDLFRESLMNGKLLVDLIRYEELPIIFRQTIPPVNHYIERKLRTRCYVSTTIFQNNSENEVCVFTGFGSQEKWEDITKGCKGVADTSESQLAQDNLTANFILLSMSRHFEKIISQVRPEQNFEKIISQVRPEQNFEKIISQVRPEQSIHLIYYKEEKLLWIKSIGNNMDLLQANLCDDDHQKEIPEEEFFEDLKNRSLLLQQFHVEIKETTIILADSPGMGKSVLLAKLAEKTRKFYSSRKDSLVFYFVVTDFIAAIQKRQGHKYESPEFLDGFITEEIVSYCSNYKLNKHILMDFVNQPVSVGKNASKPNSKTQSPPLCIFFDGLDEVTTDNIPLAFTCFQRIKNLFSSVRLHVSTRPQFLQQLENSLGSLGYHMQPFSTPDQIQFLRKYWSKARFELELDIKKLDEYGNQCLQTLQNTFTKEENDFAGIPLQCLLLAELFENDALEYADPNNVKLIQTVQPTIQVKSISQLYKRIMDRKLLKFFTRYLIRESDRMKAESILEQLHCYISIQIIIPSSEWIDKLRLTILNQKTYKQLKSILTNWKCSFSDFQSGMLPRHEILAVGVLEETTENRWHFIHRTFAEYFIALLTSKNLNGQAYQDKKSFKFKSFVEDVILDTTSTKPDVIGLTYTPQPLVQFKYPVICHFVNSMLQSSQNNRPNVPLKPQYLNIIQACICGKFESILQKYDCYLNQQNSEEMKALLVLAAQKSSLEIFKLVAKHNLSNFQSILIEVAVKDGNLPVFSYVQNSLPDRAINFSNELLPLLVKDTTQIDHLVLQSKSKILTSLLEKQPNLISLRICDKFLPFMQPNINIQLLKQLVLTSKPENILEEKDEYYRTILHITAEYLKAADYIELIQTITNLGEDVAPSLLKCLDIFDLTPLHYFILLQEPTLDLLNVLNENGADFCTIDDTGYSVLWTAIKQNLKLEFIRKLMEYQMSRTNTNLKDEFKRTTLHIAAQHYKDKILLQILITEGYDINAEDTFGNTPIFYALRNPNPSTTNACIHFLLDKEANILHRNKNGQTLMHVAAQLGKIKSIELLFQLGFSIAAFNKKSNSIFTSLKDCKGNTALHYALRSSYENKSATINVLVERFSSDINQLNIRDECPLHYALKGKNATFSVDVMKYILPKISHWPEELISLTEAYIQKMDDEDGKNNFIKKNLLVTIKEKRKA